MEKQYIGARYVPLFYENSDGTAEWRANTIYEPLTIVTWNLNSYTSKKPVPASVGDPDSNPDYWVATGLYNAQVNALSEKLEMSVKAYSSVNEMVSDTTIRAGNFINTFGYYTANDGGAAAYIIRTIEPETHYERLTNGLYAELINFDNIYNVKCYGAIGDSRIENGTITYTGTDNTAAFQSAIDDVVKAGGGTIFVPDGNFACGELFIPSHEGIKFSGNLGKYSGYNGTIVATSVNLFSITTPHYGFKIENINFHNKLSTSTNITKLINAVNSGSGYIARFTAKNITVANFYYAFDLMTSEGTNDFADGCYFENINFRTVHCCFRMKHCEATTINNCFAEPFIKYFIRLDQTGGCSITNCIMRSLPTEGTDIAYGIVSTGTANSGRNLFIRNTISEDVDCFALLATPNTIIENCRYTINRIPRLNPVILGASANGTANNTLLKNLIINYEVATAIENVLLNLGTIAYDLGVETVTLATLSNADIRNEGIRLTFKNNNDLRRVYKNVENEISYNARRVFFGASSLKEGTTAPDGSPWIIGDILICFVNAVTTQRHNHIIGYLYTQSGTNEYKWIAITAGVDSMTATDAAYYKGAEVGQMSFDTTNNKPIFWNGSVWKYADGTNV